MLATVGVGLVVSSLAFAGYGDPTPGDGGGYDPSGGTGDDYGGGGGGGGDGADAGRLKLTLTAKRKQRSLRVVKLKATCENRACTVDASGKLRAGDAKAKLKPDGEALAAGETGALKLKLAKRAKRTAKAALRDDERLTVKAAATARGVGGGGSASGLLRIRLKR
jgi:hypothetical protein